MWGNVKKSVTGKAKPDALASWKWGYILRTKAKRGSGMAVSSLF
jgi:hypothetical protein